MLNIDSLKSEVIKEVEQISFKKVDASTKILSEEYLDSMGRVDFAIWLEEKYKVKIKDIEINESNFGTVESIALYVFNKLQKNE